MKKQTKTITALFVIGAIILSIVMTKSIASRPANTSEYTQLSFGGDVTGIEDVSDGTEVTVTYTNGIVRVTGTGLYSVQETGPDGQGHDVPKYNVYATGNVCVEAIPNAGYTADLREEGTLLNAATNNYYDLGGETHYNIEAEFMNAPGNTDGKVIAKGAEGTYTAKRYNPDTHQEEEVTESYANSYVNAAFTINDSQIAGCEIPEGDVPATTTLDLSYNQGYSDTTVDISFRCLIDWKYVDSVKVNGTSYDVPDFSNRDVWLKHHEGQELFFTIKKVPKDANDEYEVELKMEPSTSMFVGNFLWTGNPEEQYRPGPGGTQELNDDYVGNSRIELVSVEYQNGNQTIKKNVSELKDNGEQHVGPSEVYHNYSTADRYVEFGTLEEVNGAAPGYDCGSMVVAEGAKVTLRIVPEYGYQVTAFTINGEDVVTGDNVSEFTFTIHGGNQHIGARVTKVDNDVKATATEVNADNSGIILGDGTLDSGTARLSIDDADISAEKKSEFEDQVSKLEAADGEEYEIAAIFDINLNQVFYKGNEGTDVWVGDSLEELATEASMELSLNDVNMNGAKLVHNVHNEAEYEVIEARAGNTETNTSVYPVNSFSTYAVVTRKNADSKTEEATEEVNNDSKNPKTGDYIIIACTVFVAASMVLVVTKRAKSKRNK